jgi:hypothetical protein
MEPLPPRGRNWIFPGLYDPQETPEKEPLYRSVISGTFSADYTWLQGQFQLDYATSAIADVTHS